MGVKQNLHDYVADQIRDKIITKSYTVGVRLPNEYKLAEEYDVCRYTIREAIKKLTATGLVEVQRGRGTFVSGSIPSSYLKNVVDQMILDDREIREIFVARITIEQKITELAAQNVTPNGVEQLEKSVLAMEEAITNKQADVYNEMDLSFHSIIAEVADNGILKAVLDGLQEMIQYTIKRSAVKIGNHRKSIDGHRKILACIKNHDYVNASQEMVKHLETCLRLFAGPLKDTGKPNCADIDK